MCYFCVLFLTEINQEMIEDIKKACQVMNEGGVILYPTDTVWGIGCDATNEEAVRRVYEIKKRADSKASLMNKIDIRLGSGLEILQPNEVDI